MPAKKKDERSLKALKATAELFAKKPNASTEEFREVAEKADSSIKGLSPRSFNAKYVLPLKRSAAAVKGKGKTAAKKAAEKITAKAAGRTKKKRGRQKRKPGKKAAARDEGVTASDVRKVRQLVTKRDQEVMAAAADPSKAYTLAQGVEDFVEKILKAAS